MDTSITLGIFQFSPKWEDITANNNYIEKQINKQFELPDILILPEMYSTGFCVSPQTLVPEMLEAQLTWQQQISEKYNITVLGSVPIKKGGSFVNRLFVTQKAQEPQFYDKSHLVNLERDSGNFIRGDKRLVIEINGVKILPLICYDLRFPVWSRNNCGYHLLIYVANWPAERNIIWETLLRARAIENQCFCIGVNRTGKDENGINYIGNSAIYSAKGEPLLEVAEKEGIYTTTLSIQELEGFRHKFGAIYEADPFELKSRE